MYQLRSSSAKIGIRLWASQIRVDVVVWAIVSEYVIDGKKFFFESVWLSVCGFVSEEDVIEKFAFFFGYGFTVEEIICISRYFPSQSCPILKMCQTFNNHIFWLLKRALFMVNQNSSSDWIDA